VVSGNERSVAIGDQKYRALYDQVHLILEYPADSKFGSHKAQRANRFIVSRDFSNGALASLDSLASVKNQKVDALIIAGVHIMDGMLSKEIRTMRLLETKRQLESFPSTRIHFEMGSTGDSEFTKEMISTLGVDSIGLNEQEFFTVCESLGHCKLEDKATVAGAVPPVVKVQAAIAAVFEKLPKLTRLHFHSFAYHIVAERKSAASVWPNAEKAVAAGSVVATTRACVAQVKDLHGNKLSLSISSIKINDENGLSQIIDISPSSPVAKFSTKEISFYLAPVVACAVPKQTVGLGDYISAYALASQL
jgi:ADP-dependent phosphofructokinase/glucokinase